MVNALSFVEQSQIKIFEKDPENWFLGISTVALIIAIILIIL